MESKTVTGRVLGLLVLSVGKAWGPSWIVDIVDRFFGAILERLQNGGLAGGVGQQKSTKS